MNPVLHGLVVQPLVRRLTRLRIEHGERLPVRGPAIIVANHNSHADTALLLAAVPSRSADLVRPVAAADYWFRNRFLAWFSTRVLGAVPIDRSGGDGCLDAASAALDDRDIVIVFPEGTRGEPGRLGRFRSGVARLAAMHPEADVVPVWIDGSDRLLPRHARWPHRVRCTVRVGEPVELDASCPGESADLVRGRVAALR